MEGLRSVIKSPPAANTPCCSPAAATNILEPYRGQVQGVIAGVRGLTPAYHMGLEARGRELTPA